MDHKSCIRCTSYIRCKDPRRSIVFFCDQYKVTQQSLVQEKAVLEEYLELPFHTSTVSTDLAPTMPSFLEDTGFNAYDTLKAMLEDKRIVSPDIKIPEGDFAEAPNFYTWCVSDKFLDQKPFVMQALIGTKLFSEYCPVCSDTDWMENEVRVGDSLGKFIRKVSLLEYGCCPSCGLTKLDFFKKGLLNPYYELALSAGQRSGKSALFGMMASYLTHRMIKLERPNEVFGLLKANVLQGTFVALTFAQAKDTLWEPFYGHLLEAPWFCIAEDTPITVVGGTVPIQDVVPGTLLPSLEGPDEVVQVFDNGVQDCKLVTLECGKQLPGTDAHQVRCLSADGQSLVWKTIAELTSADFVVVEDDNG